LRFHCGVLRENGARYGYGSPEPALSSEQTTQRVPYAPPLIAVSRRSGSISKQKLS